MSNKKCYIVGGLGCSGKTTFARDIASQMGIPCFMADNIHVLLANKIGMPFSELAKLVMPKNWDDKPLESFPNKYEAFKQAYLDFFNYLPPEQFVIDGESLIWNKRERKILEEILPDYTFRYLILAPDYEQWLKNMSKREKDGSYSPKFRDEKEYNDLLSQYLTYAPDNSMIVRDIKNTKCSPTGGTVYQNEAFSDPKWEVFDFPKDLKDRSFLEISCNTGWFLKKAGERGAKVYGVDISWQVLDIAMDRNPTGVFWLSKIEDFQTTSQFDYILCSSAFHYYHHREEQLAKISKMTKNFILETPVLLEDREFIRYQGGEDGEFCSVPSEKLLLRWLSKYFKKVTVIGETIQPDSHNRPVYLCQNG